MATRKEGIPMGAGYHTDIKDFNVKTLTREMYILKKNSTGTFNVLGTYKISNGKPARLEWAKTPKTESAERMAIAKQIDIYEKLK